MRTISKSPLAVAQEALNAAKRALPAYSCDVSRKDYTQHQLLAILVLREFLHMDYRGIVVMLREWSDLRKLLDLKKVPHHTTLFYAAQRILKKKEKLITS